MFDMSLDGTHDLQGHRGARGKRPENTIPAFEYCIESGMTTIELDICMTRDHQLIVHHDTVLNARVCRRENGRPVDPLPIRDLTVAELKSLDCGYGDRRRFPEQVQIKGTALITLNELFDFIIKYENNHTGRGAIRFNIETKFGKNPARSEIKRMAQLLVDTIARNGMAGRSTVQSFLLDVLPEVRQLDNRLQTSALFGPGCMQKLLLKSGFGGGRERLLQETLRVQADIISPHFLYMTPEFIRRCHDSGKKVIPWVLNTERIMEDCLDWGVDGIISDYPDRLCHVYAGWTAKRRLQNTTATRG